MRFHRYTLLGAIVLRVVAIFCAATALTIDAAEAAASSYRVGALVWKGDPAPGSGTTFGSSLTGVDWIRDTDAGGTGFVFSATLQNQTSGIYEVRDGEMLLVRLTGDPAPVGDTYASFGSVSMATDGSLAFSARVSGDTLDRLFRLREAGDEVIATIGDLAPGTGGGTFSWFYEISLNTAGDILFRADLSGGTEGIGLFLASAGNTSAVGVRGQDSPRGSPYYGGFDYLGLNDAGDMAFSAGDEIGPIVVSIKAGIPTIIAADLTVAPGTGGDSHLTSWPYGFIGVSLAEDGRINYVSTLNTCFEQGLYPYYCALFQWDGVETRLIARDGQSLPQGGGTFRDLQSSTSAGESGDVAFKALNVGVPGGIYLERGQLLDAAHMSYMPELWQFASASFTDPQLSASHEILFTLTFFNPRQEALYLARPISTLVPSLSPLAGALLAVALCTTAGWILAGGRAASSRR